MNRVQLVGRLGRDPELRHAGETPVLTLGVATNDRTKVRGEWTDITMWHRVVLFGRSAEGLAKIAVRGSLVSVTGRLATREFADRSGAERKVTEVIADDVRHLSRPGDGHREAQSRAPRSSHTDELAGDAPLF